MRKTNIFLMLLLLLASCGGKQHTSEPVPMVQTATVESCTALPAQEFPGRVEAARKVNMAFKVSGTLQKLYVEEGSRVKRGAPIAQIAPRDYRLQYEAAEAEYQKIKAEAERVIALYGDSVSTADAYDKARYGLQQITAKRDNARNQLADTEIRAPFDGVVQKCFFDPPTVVSAGMPVVTLISDSRNEVEINLPASAYARRGDIVSYSTAFDFLPGQTIPLQLLSIAPRANANQLYTVRLLLPDGLQKEPAPGMGVMVRVAFAAGEGELTRLPASALFTQGEQTRVWLLSTDGTVQSRPVTVQSLHGDGSAIVSRGLKPGDVVVSAGVHKLAEGQKVKPMPAPARSNVGGLL